MRYGLQIGDKKDAAECVVTRSYRTRFSPLIRGKRFEASERRLENHNHVSRQYKCQEPSMKHSSTTDRTTNEKEAHEGREAGSMPAPPKMHAAAHFLLRPCAQVKNDFVPNICLYFASFEVD